MGNRIGCLAISFGVLSAAFGVASLFLSIEAPVLDTSSAPSNQTTLPDSGHDAHHADRTQYIDRYIYPYEENISENSLELSDGAEIAFNAPESLIFEQSEIIELSFSPPELGKSAADLLSSDLVGETKTEEIPFSNVMRAHLQGGQDFLVEPSLPLDRKILDNLPTVWTWKVTPRTFGDDKIIILSLYALSEENHINHPTYILTFRKRVNVIVSPWDRTIYNADLIATKYSLIVATIAAALLAGAGYIIKRKYFS